MTADPLLVDSILRARGLTNEDLVRASVDQLTFKQVQKARSGRPVTANIKAKIVRALNACGDVRYDVRALFHC